MPRFSLMAFVDAMLDFWASYPLTVTLLGAILLIACWRKAFVSGETYRHEMDDRPSDDAMQRARMDVIVRLEDARRRRNGAA